MRRGRAIRDSETGQKLAGREVLRQLLPLTNAQIDRRLAQMHGDELTVDIRHVENSDIAEGIELQQFGFGQALLGNGAAQRTEALRSGNRRRGNTNLKGLA